MKKWLRVVLGPVTAFLLGLGGLGVVSAPAHAEASYTLSGTVVDSADQALADIAVEITDPDTGWYDYQSTTATGAFSFTVPPGSYDITLSDSSSTYAGKTVPDVAVVDADVDAGSIPLEAIVYGALSGVVDDGSGHGVEGIQVRAFNGPAGDQYASTDSDGAYSFDHLRAGDWSLQFTDYSGTYTTQTLSESVTVTAGGVTAPTVHLQAIPRGSLTGRLLNAHGNPVGGIGVQVYDYDSGAFYSGSTLDTGVFSFDDILAGSYEVQLYDGNGTYESMVLPDHAVVTAGATNDLGDITLHRIPAGSITGTAGDSDGGPAAGVQVRATDTTTQAAYIAFTDVEGAFDLHTPPGTYEVSFTDENSETWASRTLDSSVVVVDEQATDLGAVVLTRLPKGSITGSVADADGPLPDASVNLYRKVGGALTYLTSTQSDSNGDYTFSGVTGGYDYTVGAAKTGYFDGYLGDVKVLDDADLVQVSDGQTTSAATLHLVKIPVVSGVLVTDDDPPLPIQGALVTGTTPDGHVSTTYTDADGSFSLKMPDGPGTIVIQNGDNQVAFGYTSANGGAPAGGTSTNLGTITVKPWHPLGDNQLAGTLGIPADTVVDTDYNADVRGAQPSSEPILGFPRQGNDYLMLSTGPIGPLSGDPGTFYSGALDDSGGVDGNDLSQVSLTLRPPAGASCLAFDFAMASEEFPEYVGSGFNDVFTADLNATDWTKQGSQVVAPNNFAYDSQGKAVSINTTGFSAVPGLIMDGATPLLRAATPVETDLDTGNMKVVFSIQDLGDSAYDSVALIDNVQWISNVDDCAKGAEALTDTDGDGLSDVWETQGIDYDGDGTPELDLPALGADPNHQDLFMEIDWMEKPQQCTWKVCWGGRSFAPQQSAVDDVKAAFAAAPRANPDGTTGINLHVDVSNAVGWQKSLGSMNGNIYDWSAFDQIKAANFDADRRDAFHYVLYADTYAGSGSSGISRGIPGQDLIVTDGHSSWGDGFTRTQERGTLMHELGHNLNLFHGGGPTGTSQNSPSYRSIMNYYYQLTGIGSTAKLDYSREDVPWDDWEHLRYDGGSVGDLGDTAPPPADTVSDSLTSQEAKDLDAFAQDGDGTLTFVGPSLLLPDTGTRDLLFDVTNAGTVATTYTVSLTSAALPGQTPSTTVEVPAGTTQQVAVPVDTTGLATGDHQLSANLATAAVPHLSSATGDFSSPDMSDPAEQAAAQDALDQLDGTDIDPAVLDQVQAMVDNQATPVSNQTAPSITGDVKVGATVTAAEGGWTPEPDSYTYRWLLDGQPIAGATASTYAIGVADLGHDLSVEVTASKADHTDGVATSAETTVAKGDAATATTAPSFTGTAKVGETLTAVDGGWSRAGVTLTHEWLLAGTPVGTGPTYDLTAAAAGKTIALRVTATQTGYENGTATSGSSVVASGDAPATSVLPKVTSSTPTARAGATLTASPGTWTLGDLSYAYQWLRDGTAIAGAVGPKYVVRVGDAAHAISVRVTASRDGYGSGTASSAALVVDRLASTTSLKAPKKAKVGKRVAITVTVTGSGVVNPTGLVTVFNGTKVLKKVTLTASGHGKVVVKVKLAKGKRKISATYAGSASVAPSKSKVRAVKVR